jgi:hypothetical protein
MIFSVVVLYFYATMILFFNLGIKLYLNKENNVYIYISVVSHKDKHCGL